MFVLQISPRNDKIHKGGGIVKYIFSHCNEAVESASQNRKFAFNYSDVQNPDLNIHIHDTCEVLFCIEGGGKFLINDTVYTVEDGDVFVINQFEAHKITSNPEKRFRRYIMQVHPEFLYSNSTDKTNLSQCFYTRGNNISNKITLSDAEMKKITNHIDNMRNKSEYGDDVLKNMAAIDILVSLNSAFSSGACEEKASGSGTIKTAIDYINKNFNNPISLEDIAKNSYVSVNQLCRLFNKYCGTTVAKYITSRRITEAKKLLATGKNVADTAILCGFEDYANFIRVFKKHVGTTPGKYTANI